MLWQHHIDEGLADLSQAQSRVPNQKFQEGHLLALGIHTSSRLSWSRIVWRVSPQVTILLHHLSRSIWTGLRFEWLPSRHSSLSSRLTWSLQLLPEGSCCARIWVWFAWPLSGWWSSLSDCQLPSPWFLHFQGSVVVDNNWRGRHGWWS